MYCRLRSRLCSALPGSAGFVVPRALGSGFGDLEFRENAAPCFLAPLLLLSSCKASQYRGGSHGVIELNLIVDGES